MIFNGIDISVPKSMDLYAELLREFFKFASNQHEKLILASVERERIEAQKHVLEQQILANIIVFEKQLSADYEHKSKFVEGSTKFIDKLIEKEEYEIANMFHERLANSFSGNSINDLLRLREKCLSFGVVRIE